MWGLFIGLPLGALQVYILNMFTASITAGKKNKALLWLIPADLVVLIGMFILMAAVSGAHLLWMATGMVAVMIILSVFIFIKRMKDSRR